MTHAQSPTVRLTHGAEMPRLGLGTWPMDDAEAEIAVARAIEAGYRLFDTAENYRNETGVGRGIRASGIAREDVFITTKFNRAWHGRELVREALAGSLQRLGTGYVDLLLIHWPNSSQDRYVEAWEGMVRLLEEGAVKAIGVSNFKPAHLERIIGATGVAPDVNQVQLNPTLTRNEVRAYDDAHGIVTQSWSPIGQGRDLLARPVITELAARHGKTPAQVVLRWHMQLGLSAVPKTSNAARMAENLAVFDFELSAEEMASLTALDRGEAAAADSDDFGH